MPEAWRLIKERHVDTAFNGEGAAKSGGRWNSKGVPVVYASGTKSLATLEVLVHLNPPISFKFTIIPVKFDVSLIEEMGIQGLPVGWRMEPPPASAQRVGDEWIKSARSAVLAIPSAITFETNYLLNPAHPDFKRIKIGTPEPFEIDPRLLK
jgi:RES domain-containing protein